MMRQYLYFCTSKARKLSTCAHIASANKVVEVDLKERGCVCPQKSQLLLLIPLAEVCVDFVGRGPAAAPESKRKTGGRV
jgi:hypothetical protein